MIHISELNSFVSERKCVPGDLGDELPTLVLEWDKAPELFWTLRLSEFFGAKGENFGYQPQVSWKRCDQGMRYEKEPVSKGSGKSLEASCEVSVNEDCLVYKFKVENHSRQPYEDLWLWLCLIHRWSRAFQNCCELPVGDKDDPWRTCAALPVPLERWLKWCPVEKRLNAASRIGEGSGAKWQPHLLAQTTSVRAWRVEGKVQQFIELNSPDAIILGWSHWPCTDMGLFVGDLEPGQSREVRGDVRFFEKEFAPI